MLVGLGGSGGQAAAAQGVRGGRGSWFLVPGTRDFSFAEVIKGLETESILDSSCGPPIQRLAS